MLSLPHGRALLVIGWLLVVIIVVGSLLPEAIGIGLDVSDKLRHFAGYFVLMLYFAGLYPRERHWLLALAFFLMGAALELLQGTLTATRAMEFGDLAVNTLGVASAFLLARLGLGDWARRLDR